MKYIQKICSSWTFESSVENLLNFDLIFHKKCDHYESTLKETRTAVATYLCETCSGKIVILDHLKVHGIKEHRVTSSHFPQNYWVREFDISKATYTNSCYKTTFKKYRNPLKFMLNENSLFHVIFIEKKNMKTSLNEIMK